jgi:hypothetical protein
MRISEILLRPHIAVCLVLLLAVPLAEGASVLQPVAPTDQQAEDSSYAMPEASHSPAMASSNTAQAANAPTAANQTPSSGGTAAPLPAQQLPAQQGNTNPSLATRPASEPQQTPSSEPVGTAAAPYQKTTGIAASRPAGAVIAPAKQKRARSFLIRVALLAGAAIALGTVAGISAATPSRPH